MAETKNPKIRLQYDKILTTFNTNKVTESGIILSADVQGQPKTRQTVVACGPNANVKVGDEVEIDFRLFPIQTIPAKNDIGPDKQSIILPIETIDKVDYFFISSREIKWIYEK